MGQGCTGEEGKRDLESPNLNWHKKVWNCMWPFHLSAIPMQLSVGHIINWIKDTKDVCRVQRELTHSVWPQGMLEQMLSFFLLDFKFSWQKTSSHRNNYNTKLTLQAACNIDFKRTGKPPPPTHTYTPYSPSQCRRDKEESAGACTDLHYLLIVTVHHY